MSDWQYFYANLESDRKSDAEFDSNRDPGDESDADSKRESDAISEGFGHPDSLRESE
jgi:hypothetical protein